MIGEERTGHGKTEVAAVVKPQAKECLKSPDYGRGKKNFSQSPRGNPACLQLDATFLASEMFKDIKFVAICYVNSQKLTHVALGQEEGHLSARSPALLLRDCGTCNGLVCCLGLSFSSVK